jgi:hypothetical protein
MRAAAIASMLALCAGCAHSPVPSSDSAVVHLTNSPMPPFWLLDFASVELRAGSLKLDIVRRASIQLGKRSILVEATKGPKGSFGQVVMSRCSGMLEFEARANQEYRIEYVRRAETDALQVVDTATGFVLDYVDCR